MRGLPALLRPTIFKKVGILLLLFTLVGLAALGPTVAVTYRRRM